MTKKIGSIRTPYLRRRWTLKLCNPRTWKDELETRLRIKNIQGCLLGRPNQARVKNWSNARMKLLEPWRERRSRDEAGEQESGKAGNAQDAFDAVERTGIWLFYRQSFQILPSAASRRRSGCFSSEGVQRRPAAAADPEGSLHRFHTKHGMIQENYRARIRTSLLAR